MQTAATAIMVLLSCSPNGHDCREIVGEKLFETVGACRKALPGTLRRMTTPSRHVIGRCAEAAHQVPGIDPIVTGTIDRRDKVITVTRFIDGKPVTTEYVVPAVD
jgi:hypothetical protein